MKKIIIFAIFIYALLPINYGSALDDNEYHELMSISRKFRNADDELSRVWKEVYSSLTGEARQKLLQNQQHWIRVLRDKVANELMAQSLSWEDAYTQATKRRIDYLRLYHQNNVTLNSNQDNLPPDWLRPRNPYVNNVPAPVYLPDYPVNIECAKLKWGGIPGEVKKYSLLNCSDEDIKVIGYKINRGNTKSLEYGINGFYNFQPINIKFGQSAYIFSVPYYQDILEVKVYTPNGYILFENLQENEK